MRPHSNILRAGLNLLEVTIATAILASVTLIASNSIKTGSDLHSTVTASTNALNGSHRVSQQVAMDMKYADLNKIYVDESGGTSWTSTGTGGTAAPRYFSLKRCTGFRTSGATSIDGLVVYGEGVVYTFAQDPADPRLGALYQSVFALDEFGNTGAARVQNQLVARNLAWQYYQNPGDTVARYGFELVDNVDQSLADSTVAAGGTTTGGTRISAAQGDKLWMHVVSVVDPAGVRAGSTVFERKAISANQLWIYLRASQFDKFATEAPVITSATTASGTVGAYFSYAIRATQNPISFAISSGSLPVGLKLNSETGQIAGNPTQVATTACTISARNAYGEGVATVVFSFTGTIPKITSSGSFSIAANDSVGYTIYATAPSAVPVLTYGLVKPTGGDWLSVDATTGVLSGRPSNTNIPTGADEAVFAYTMTATNANGTGSAPLLATVKRVLSAPTFDAARLGTPSFAYVNTSYDTPYGGFSIAGGFTDAKEYWADQTTLPPGMTCAPNGWITGIPTQETTGTVVTIYGRNEKGQAQGSVILKVQALPKPKFKSVSPATWPDYTTNISPGPRFDASASNPNGIISTISYTMDVMSENPGIGINAATGLITGVWSNPVTNKRVRVVATNEFGPSDLFIDVTVSRPTIPSLNLNTARTININSSLDFAICLDNDAAANIYTASKGAASWIFGPSTSGVLSGSPTDAALVGQTAAIPFSAKNAQGGTATSTLYLTYLEELNLPTITLDYKGVVQYGSGNKDNYQVDGTISCASGRTLNLASFNCTPYGGGTALAANEFTLTKSWAVGATGQSTASFKIYALKSKVVGAFSVTASVSDSLSKSRTKSYP